LPSEGMADVTNPCGDLERERDSIWFAYEGALKAEQDALPVIPAAPLGPLPPKSIGFGAEEAGDRLTRIDKAREEQVRLLVAFEETQRKLMHCYEKNNVAPEQRARIRKLD